MCRLNSNSRWQHIQYSGTHVVTLTNAAGCDSVVTLNLSVITPDDTARLTLSFCTGGSVAFNGTTYTQQENTL
jgi:hypothetical protein